MWLLAMVVSVLSHMPINLTNQLNQPLYPNLPLKPEQPCSSWVTAKLGRSNISWACFISWYSCCFLQDWNYPFKNPVEFSQYSHFKAYCGWNIFLWNLEWKLCDCWRWYTHSIVPLLMLIHSWTEEKGKDRSLSGGHCTAAQEICSWDPPRMPWRKVTMGVRSYAHGITFAIITYYCLLPGCCSN